MKIVQKYGGSSLADSECIHRVVQRILCDAQGNQMLVVVSAQGKTTDAMTKNYCNYSDRFPSRESDAVLACGEQISASLLVAALQKAGYDAISLNGVQVPILTSGNYGDGRIERISTARIRKEWKKGKIVVITGFQGVDKSGNRMTLGRGGSDTSAVALAAALKADRCQIFTDVDGVYSADPGKIKIAIRFDALSSNSMLDLALGGAKVLHPRAAQLAIQYQVPLEILSSFSVRAGTVLAVEAPRQNGITSRRRDDDQSEITVSFSDDNRTKTVLRVLEAIQDRTASLQYCGYKLVLTVPTARCEEYLYELHDLLFLL